MAETNALYAAPLSSGISRRRTRQHEALHGLASAVTLGAHTVIGPSGVRIGYRMACPLLAHITIGTLCNPASSRRPFSLLHLGRPKAFEICDEDGEGEARLTDTGEIWNRDWARCKRGATKSGRPGANA